MPAAIAIANLSAGQRTISVYGTITLTGSYTVNGDSLPASSFKAGTTKKPLIIDIQGKGLFTYSYDVEAEKIKAFTAGAELTAAAYPAGALADVLRFEAVFPKFG